MLLSWEASTTHCVTMNTFFLQRYLHKYTGADMRWANCPNWFLHRFSWLFPISGRCCATVTAQNCQETVKNSRRITTWLSATCAWKNPLTETCSRSKKSYGINQGYSGPRCTPWQTTHRPCSESSRNAQGGRRWVAAVIFISCSCMSMVFNLGSFAFFLGSRQLLIKIFIISSDKNIRRFYLNKSWWYLLCRRNMYSVRS